VIVPAAGVGSRLRPFTDARPKQLFAVDGTPILATTLEQLAAAGVEEVICVTGHFGDVLEHELRRFAPRPELRFVRNRDYATTNSIVSLALTWRWWSDDFCIVDSDVCVTRELLDRLLSASGDALVVDTSKEWAAIDMHVELRDGVVAYLDKELPPERSAGEFFGLSRWTPAGAEVFARSVDRMLALGRSDVWYELAIRDAAAGLALRVVEARAGEWAELDAPEDVESVTRLVRRERSSAVVE
jgi:L-glutamine-phosphate cytidylyltransferase